jgi:RNA 3'-terminal phosphate cyclase (ATP)
MVDGAQGEGGGQILRSSLALSTMTQQPFRIVNIRAGRKKPGLLRQHLTAAKAAARVCCGHLEGAAPGSQELTFVPGPVAPGSYHFDVGSAGSATLVLQTVLPPLLTASGPSTLVLEGGTHNPHAPPFDFLAESFLPLIDRMGPRISAVLERPGFFPAGGGRFRVTVEPAAALAPFDLLERGPVTGRRARALVAHLPRSIAEREMKVVREKLRWPHECCEVVEDPGGRGPGNAVTIAVTSEAVAFEAVTEVFTGFGARGVPAEVVACQAVDEAEPYLAADVPVGIHLADQLLLPFAQAGGGAFRTLPPTLHTRTNIAVIRQFTGVDIDVENHDGSTLIRVGR